MKRSANLHVLDHGYIRFIEDWGRGEFGDAECGIIEAARMSTEGSFRGWDEDERLLKFLYNADPKHATPFEMAGLIIEVQAPIMVFREWHRHRTQSYNELSARYTPLPDLNYSPDIDILLQRSAIAATTKNRQASGTGKILDRETATVDLYELREYYIRGQHLYESMLDNGWPKELARLPVTVGRYSRMRASANLRNWLAFMTLRADPGAQWEIRQYAFRLGEIIMSCFPRTWDLFYKEMAQKGVLHLPS